MEDDLKILKVYYLSSYLILEDQPKIENFLKWRRPPMEDNLKILKVEYPSNYWSDLPQILNLCLRGQTKIEYC